MLDEELRSLDASVEEIGGAALPAIQAAARRMRERDERERLMWLSPLLARALAFHRQYDAAEAVAKEALSHFRQVGSGRGQAMALIVHGLAHVMQGRSAHALDADGNELSSQSEGLIRSFTDVPERTYDLETPNFEKIAAIRFDSDPRLNGVPFAGFSAVLIERLTVTGDVQPSP